MPPSNKPTPRRLKDIDISGIRKIFEAAGSSAINLGLGQPDMPTPAHICQAAIKAIEEGFTGYTQGPGIPELREAVAEKFRRENHLEVEPEEVIVTSGASEALHLALEALVEEGDEVLVPDPGFVSYQSLTRIAGAKPVGVPLDENLKVDPEQVQERLTSRTKVLILNSPSNPTGSVQSREEIKALAELAGDHGITIISDEVYEHFIYEGQHHSPARFYERVVTVNAVSKTYSMTGWRLGYLAAPPDLVYEMLKVHQYIQACASSISQRAALAALTGPQDCVSEMRDEFKERRNLLIGGLEKLGVECVKPRGAFYAFPRIPLETAERLIENGVIVVPGTSFGKHGKGHTRLSYATSQENLRKALEIMEKIIT